jgi:uncharacterized protein Yka (UPF0111/DUF47 family)
LSDISIGLFALSISFKDTGNDFMSLKMKHFRKRIKAIEKSTDEILRNKEIKIHLESLSDISIGLFALSISFKDTGNDYMSLKMKHFRERIKAIEKSIDEILRNIEQANKNM